MSSPTLERGTWDLLRERLAGHAAELGKRAKALDERRRALFGGTELELVGSARVRTDNACLPRDLVALGERRLLMGFDVHLGLRAEPKVEDVLSLVELAALAGDAEVTPASPEAAAFLHDERFRKDVGELFRFYKDARLVRLRREEGKLLVVFRTGQGEVDLKALRFALEPGAPPRYVDNRGERDATAPAAASLEWRRVGRENFVLGRFPHVSIADEVFVEMVGGDLTIKVEDNTDDGQGIYREPVEDPNQGLDDGEIAWARVGSLILLKMRPFREDAWRGFVFDSRRKRVRRVDGIVDVCLRLPEDHGIVFPGGCALDTGEIQVFEGAEAATLELAKVVRAPNGEDVLYVWRHRHDGRVILFFYNLVRRELATPLVSRGWSVFADGTLVLARASGTAEPARVHHLELWRSPFSTPEHFAARPSDGSYLASLGNAEVVRALADCRALGRLATEPEPTRSGQEAVIAFAQKALDSHHWLGREEAGDLAGPIAEIRRTADLLLAELDKVEAQRAEAAQALAALDQEAGALAQELRPEAWKTVDDAVAALAALRRLRGKAVSLRELRFVDGTALDQLEQQLGVRADEAAKRTVDFLLGDDALAPYGAALAAIEAKLPAVKTASMTTELRDELTGVAERLTLLTELVSTLPATEATRRTTILERVSEVLSRLNRTRATVEAKRRELLEKEGSAELQAQLTVFSQSVAGAVAMSDSPEACDRELARLLLQLEELETQFADLESFAEALADRREELHQAFATKRQQLVEERRRQIDGVARAGQRVLEGIRRRASSFANAEELNTFHAADPMVMRLRELIEKLRRLGDPVRADELATGLAASRDQGLRAMRDKGDLFEAGGTVIRLGRHRFSVNEEPLALAVVPSDDGLVLQLAGTDYRTPLDDPRVQDARDLWHQLLVSESDEVARAEYLAFSLFTDAERERGGAGLQRLAEAALDPAALLALVRERAAERLDEGYERGVHDQDAALVLARLLELAAGAGTLRYAPRARAVALLWMAEQPPGQPLRSRAVSLARLRSTFAGTAAADAARADLAADLATAVSAFAAGAGIELPAAEAELAASYLIEELGHEQPRPTVGATAVRLRDGLLTRLDRDGSRPRLLAELAEKGTPLGERFELARAWLLALLDQDTALAPARPEVDGAAALLLIGDALATQPSAARLEVELEGLVSNHPRIVGGKLALRLDELLDRIGGYRRDRVPRFRAWVETKRALIAEESRRLGLDELLPKPMSTFVRNRLIDEVYLPIIGDNLAKQLGTVGEGRGDRSGLLLLVSPPGYGKTTLMEYVAHRLGLTFVKVNGPALGHAVTSLDPAEAPNATARREVERIALALEMGSNVLLYLDDIQHTHPELLQKFISLCDAQRRIEAVWRGRTRTYDLRGKRFAVVMAGNPYTESGEQFRIPDMLANRADVYNLGQVLAGREDLFALSYLENALTANPVLNPLAGRDPKDVPLLVAMARGEEIPPDRLSHTYAGAELQDVLAVFRHLTAAQKVLLAVNRQYIDSAAQQENFRTEPPFLLQGSYRNMSKIAARVVPVMTAAELENLLDDHYLGEAQTLTTGAEHNLLKLAQLRGRATPEQQQRWEQIVKEYRRHKLMGGGGEDDPATRVVGTLGLVSDRIDAIGTAIEAAAAKSGGDAAGQVVQGLAAMQSQLAAIGGAIAKASQPQGSGPELASALEKLGASLAQTGGTAEAAHRLEVRLASIAEGIRSLASRGSAGPPPAETSGETPAIADALARLGQGLETLAAKPAGGATIIQALPPGVLEILSNMIDTVGESLLPTLRGIEKKMGAEALLADKRLLQQLTRTQKLFDHLRDLLDALRKIDTRAGQV